MQMPRRGQLPPAAAQEVLSDMGRLPHNLSIFPTTWAACTWLLLFFFFPTYPAKRALYCCKSTLRFAVEMLD